MTCPPFFTESGPFQRLGRMARKQFSTNDIARMCSVTRQTVINWIKGGKLKAVYTPGGHRRVGREDLLNFFRQNRLDTCLVLQFEEERRKEIPYCWEYFRTGFTSRWSNHNCENCLVKQVRALRCYLLRGRSTPAEEKCHTSCDQCLYMKRYGAILQEAES